MHVLSFISSLDLTCGGPSRSVPAFVVGLASAGVDVTLLTVRSDNMNLSWLPGSNVHLIILDSNYRDSILEDIVKSGKYDIIQVQSIWDYCYHKLIKVAVEFKIPYVITPRGMLEPWCIRQKMIKKKLALAIYQYKDLNNAACIYTTSEMESMHVRDMRIKVPCSIIPNGLEIDGYPCRNSRTQVKKRVLFLSRIHEKKGIEILIDVWKNIYLDFPEWCVEIVGNGDSKYIDSLKAKISSLGLGQAISILPPVFGEDKVSLYQESALFVLPSYSENFGMVIAEAMSCGVPVITTTNCPWTVLNDSNTGWCIDLNIDNLEKAIRHALSMETSELFDMGQRASKLIYENFNYRSVALKTKELYRWIIEGGDKPEFVI